MIDRINGGQRKEVTNKQEGSVEGPMENKGDR